MKKFLAIILTVLLTVLTFAGCDAGGSIPSDDGRLTVVTTVFPVYDWTRSITGDLCNVIYLDKNGTDMHSFEPTANDILALAGADVFIHIGGTSDKWVEAALASADNDTLRVFTLTEATGVLEEEAVEGMQTHHEEEAEADEHIWLSLRRAQTAVDAICNALSEADSSNAAAYRSNADGYIKQLADLDKDFENCVAGSKRKVLLFADRFPFRYLTEDYGIEYYAAFPGCSAETEASFSTLASLIDKTKTLSLPCIIVIENSSAGIAEAISDKTGAKILTMHSCQSVTAKHIENGLTYLSVMKDNLQVISEALN